MPNRVVISAAAIQKQVTPGVQQWVNRVTRDIQVEATLQAPVNNPNNALHRGGRVGTYKRGLKQGRAVGPGPLPPPGRWGWRGTVDATAPHSYWVEKGRKPNKGKLMVFSWTGAVGTKWDTRRSRYGKYGPVFTEKVAGYDGHHTLEDAFEHVVRRLDI